jgi:hypothetical protein
MSGVISHEIPYESHMLYNSNTRQTLISANLANITFSVHGCSVMKLSREHANLIVSTIDNKIMSNGKVNHAYTSNLNLEDAINASNNVYGDIVAIKVPTICTKAYAVHPTSHETARLYNMLISNVAHQGDDLIRNEISFIQRSSIV